MRFWTVFATIWLAPIRRAGINRFAEQGFPTLQHEDWRFTNIAPIVRLPFKPADKSNADVLVRESLDQTAFAKAAEAAKDGCPVSGALKGNVAFELDAKLE